MKQILIILILLIVLNCILVQGTELQWENCGGGEEDDIFQIETLTITPQSPNSGQNVTIITNGTLTEPIKYGSIHVLIKLGYVTVLKKEYKMCEVFKCPLYSSDGGHISQAFTYSIEKEIPRAKFNVIINFYNGEDYPIACLSFKYNNL